MRVLRLLAAVLVLAGCGTATPPGRPAVLPRPSRTPWGTPRITPRVTPPAAGETARTSTGWEITVYYTAVEEFHHGPPEQVTGCPRLACAHGGDDLGSYPADFVAAVRSEGTGRTTSGRYLNWSYDVGFWLDTAPRDTDGDPLEPYVSAAADPGALPRGSRFTVLNCGRQDDGSVPSPVVCGRFRQARWRVADEFTPGLGGRRHIDAYIGPETGPGFTGSGAYVTLHGVTLRLA